MGPPYSGLWPEARAAALNQDGRVFVSTDDWTSTASAFGRTGDPPESMRLVGTGASNDVIPREYPSNWPFGPPKLP